MLALSGKNCTLSRQVCHRNSVLPFTPAKLHTGSTSTCLAIQPFSSVASPLCQPSLRGRLTTVRASQNEGSQGANYSKEFGYSRKDIILIGAGLIGLGYVMYYGLQATGMEPGMAGNWVQLIIFLGICVGWVSSYLFRVATKQMTYVKQLEAYEDAVIRKRLEEMTEEELQDLMKESEAERARRLKGNSQQQ